MQYPSPNLVIPRHVQLWQAHQDEGGMEPNDAAALLFDAGMITEDEYYSLLEDGESLD